VENALEGLGEKEGREKEGRLIFGVRPSGRLVMGRS